MHGAEPPDEVARINRYDLSRGEQRCQRVQGDAVVGIVEYWHEDDAVCDVEIGVAGGKTPLLKDYRTRHGKLDDVQRLARLITRGLQTAKVVTQRLVIFFLRGSLGHGEY